MAFSTLAGLVDFALMGVLSHHENPAMVFHSHVIESSVHVTGEASDSDMAIEFGKIGYALFEATLENTRRLDIYWAGTMSAPGSVLFCGSRSIIQGSGTPDIRVADRPAQKRVIEYIDSGSLKNSISKSGLFSSYDDLNRSRIIKNVINNVLYLYKLAYSSDQNILYICI